MLKCFVFIILFASMKFILFSYFVSIIGVTVASVDMLNENTANYLLIYMHPMTPCLMIVANDSTTI